MKITTLLQQLQTKDLTSYKQLGVALEESEKKYRKLIGSKAMKNN
jgi:hypothetical protein